MSVVPSGPGTTKPANVPPVPGLIPTDSAVFSAPPTPAVGPTPIPTPVSSLVPSTLAGPENVPMFGKAVRSNESKATEGALILIWDFSVKTNSSMAMANSGPRRPPNANTTESTLSASNTPFPAAFVLRNDESGISTNW